MRHSQPWLSEKNRAKGLADTRFSLAAWYDIQSRAGRFANLGD